MNHSLSTLHCDPQGLVQPLACPVWRARNMDQPGDPVVEFVAESYAKARLVAVGAMGTGNVAVWRVGEGAGED